MTNTEILTEALCSAIKTEQPTGLLWRELFKSLDIPIEWLDR